MKLPPLLLRLRIESRQQRWPTLWLPLFLLWPLLFSLLLLLALPAFVLVCICAPRALGSLFAVAGALYTVLCEARGTLVDIAGEPSRVFIAIH